MNNTYLRGVYLRLAGAVTLIVLLALAGNALLSHRTFEHALAPQLAAKLASEGASVRSLVYRAAENGIGFTDLYGVKERFADAKEEAPELSYIAFTDTAGNILTESGTTPAGAAALFRQPAVLGLLHTPDQVSPPTRIGTQYFVSMPMALPGRPLGMLQMPSTPASPTTSCSMCSTTWVWCWW